MITWKATAETFGSEARGGRASSAADQVHEVSRRARLALLTSYHHLISSRLAPGYTENQLQLSVPQQMASSSAGSSRSSSSNRKVERTLSDSTFGNMMLSLKAPIATSRDKGKRKATVVQDDADDVIVVELGGARQTSSSKSRPSRASSSVAAATSIATSRSTRPTQPAASEASSSTLVAPKNTQRKRKAEPGDGFKMNFKHSQAVIQPTSTSRNSSSSYRDPTRPSKPRPTAPPPSASSFASSSRSHQSSTKPSFTTADAPPTQSESSFTSILPSALAGSTQGKPKLRPLQAFRPPPSFTIRSTSPLSSPPTVKAAAQPPPPPRPSPPLLSAAAVDPRQRSASPPPTPPKAPSPRKRKRTPLQLRSPTIDRTLSTTDWAELHPSLETSHLFRLEYALHGGLTYNQTRTALKKEQFTKVTRKSVPAAAVVLHDEPSWIDDEVAVGTLKKELGDKEHFVAVVWARDVLGRNKMEEGSVGEEGELRKAVIGGVDMYLLGKEFPLKLVIFVGMIVGISEKDTIISYEGEPLPLLGSLPLADLLASQSTTVLESSPAPAPSVNANPSSSYHLAKPTTASPRADLGRLRRARGRSRLLSKRAKIVWRLERSSKSSVEWRSIRGWPLRIAGSSPRRWVSAELPSFAIDRH